MYVNLNSIVFLFFSFLTPEKMSPHDLSSPTSPAMDPEEILHRRMIKRSKVIEELVRTEGDYQKELELCISEVLLPLRAAQACSQSHNHISEEIYSLKFVAKNK